MVRSKCCRGGCCRGEVHRGCGNVRTTQTLPQRVHSRRGMAGTPSSVRAGCRSVPQRRASGVRQRSNGADVAAASALAASEVWRVLQASHAQVATACRGEAREECAGHRTRRMLPRRGASGCGNVRTQPILPRRLTIGGHDIRERLGRGIRPCESRRYALHAFGDRILRGGHSGPSVTVNAPALPKQK